ncbi:MAG: SPFH domain-containing protein [Acidimicrobiales bacterium]
MFEALGGLLVVMIIVVVAYVAMGVKIVRPYQRGVVERLGRYKETTDPGLRIILPFFERLRPVDMREQVIDVPPQEVITQDNVAVSVDAVIYFEATDPQRLLYNISNFVLAVTKLAQTNLRNVIGEMTLDQAFTSRERVNGALRQILDEATDKWGVRVVRVEIQRIDPPADVMHAMHEQMKAERTRRAVVTEAEGVREASITRAQGEKESAILTAEGQRQRDVLRAEGEAQATVLRADADKYMQEVVAEGEAHAIESVYNAILDSGADDRVIAIKYLEALQGIANGTATKIFVPADMGAALGSIGGIAELFKGDGPLGGAPEGGAPRRPAAKKSSAANRTADRIARSAKAPDPHEMDRPDDEAAPPRPVSRAASGGEPAPAPAPQSMRPPMPGQQPYPGQPPQPRG